MCLLPTSIRSLPFAQSHRNLMPRSHVRRSTRTEPLLNTSSASLAASEVTRQAPAKPLTWSAQALCPLLDLNNTQSLLPSPWTVTGRAHKEGPHLVEMRGVTNIYEPAQGCRASRGGPSPLLQNDPEARPRTWLRGDRSRHPALPFSEQRAHLAGLCPRCSECRWLTLQGAGRRGRGGFHPGPRESEMPETWASLRRNDTTLRPRGGTVGSEGSGPS